MRPLVVAAVAAVALLAPRSGAAARVVHATPADYLARLAGLGPGDTLLLAPGEYENAAVPGLPVFDLHGTPDAPITIAGPRSGRPAVLIGQATHNTVRIANASHVVIRDLTIDGRDRGGDGVNAEGVSHHITLENLTIKGVGTNQRVAGISTNRAPAWHWIIRGNLIAGAGTGVYLGNSDGRHPFVAGVIEHNVVRDTIGYNLQIKHQAPWPAIDGLPQGRTVTLIRHNVFAKGATSSTGRMARPNVLVGDVPATGPGSTNHYEIYGNLFLGNPSEALFQGEGCLALYANGFVNPAGPAIVVRPHNGGVREVQVFGNTIVARGAGIVAEGDPDHVQRADVNVVFAEPAIVARNQLANLVGPYEDAPRHLVNPLAPPGQLDLTPRPRAARGPPIDVGEWRSFTDWNRDFDGRARRWTIRGAYSIDGPAIRQRNERKSDKARGPRANRTAHLATQTPGVAVTLEADRAVNAPGT